MSRPGGKVGSSLGGQQARPMLAWASLGFDLRISASLTGGEGNVISFVKHFFEDSLGFCKFLGTYFSRLLFSFQLQALALIFSWSDYNHLILFISYLQ